MNTNSAAAMRARPSHFFICHEFSYAIFLNVYKIFDHAHVVFGPVSFIQMFQIAAGKIVTSKTKLSAFLNDLAFFDFASNDANGFIGICCPATWTFIFFSQIGHANATVHAAGSDK